MPIGEIVEISKTINEITCQIKWTVVIQYDEPPTHLTIGGNI